MNRAITLCGLVLAGGRSSRMGHDKAALVHPDGRTMVQRCCDLLREAGCSTVAVSLRHDQELPRGLDEVVIVRDPPRATGGPLAGIVAGMHSNADSDWLVVACDLPRLDLRTLTHLIDSTLPSDRFLAYRSESDGLPEPLAAYYAAAALPIWEAALAEDLRCPRKILIRENCRLIAAVTPRALENANTPQDWASAILP